MQRERESASRDQRPDKGFPGVQALDHVDFTLHAGEIHGLLGENGAGKSTLIKMLTACSHRDGGTMRLDGQDIRPAIRPTRSRSASAPSTRR